MTPGLLPFRKPSDRKTASDRLRVVPVALAAMLLVLGGVAGVTIL